MEPLYQGLFAILKWCCGVTGNFALAIVLFTLITKIILLPVSIWTYYESIKMIKIQPDVNLIKAKYYGQKDIIAEEEAKLYKEKHYHPLVSVIPLILQLVLLLGVVGAVRMAIADPSISMKVGGLDMGLIPAEHGISRLWPPIIAAFTAWLMCVAQNKSNVLQAEQSKFNKYGTMILSVGLSLYLGWFVPIGVAVYWICSNLFAILQLYILNAFMRPRRFVDYEKLEMSRSRLAELNDVGGGKKDRRYKNNKRREKEDYKRFFNVVNKHLVFYSESSGFYKYYRDYIDQLLKKTKMNIHYITSDPDDAIFKKAEEEPRIRAYYIGENKLITLMMKMDTYIMAMTMPDIENYHIKRSYVRKDIEYLYMMHGIGSNSMLLRKGALDHYDTIFCCGEHQDIEIRETEQIYGLPEKKLVDVGYPLIDSMRAEYNKKEHPEHERKKILIAPSWQKDNIVDSCLEELLDSLRDKDYDIIVRPHPQEVRHKKEYMENLKKQYAPAGIEIQTDFSSDNPVMEADLLITDWSDISWEYAFTTLRPVLFINTPMKVMNPEYDKISLTPMNITLRDKAGLSLDTDRIGEASEKAAYLLSHRDEYRKTIGELAEKYMYNLDRSAEIGSDYIIRSLLYKIKIKNKGDKK